MRGFIILFNFRKCYKNSALNECYEFSPSDMKNGGAGRQMKNEEWRIRAIRGIRGLNRVSQSSEIRVICSQKNITKLPKVELLRVKN